MHYKKHKYFWRIFHCVNVRICKMQTLERSTSLRNEQMYHVFNGKKTAKMQIIVGFQHVFSPLKCLICFLV